jgi:hypothetical protein
MMNEPMKIRAIITGATGMVGEGVLHECLQSDEVESVLLLSRKHYSTAHQKVKEILHENFLDISIIKDQLIDYNACFFCLGVSSIGMKEADYTKLTHTLTMHVADTLCQLNPAMTFCYISGARTDSSEKGRSMWARVKGKTENDLMKLPFKQVYNFRPGIIKPTKGLKNTLSLYKYLGWLFPVLNLFFSKNICTLKEIGLAMIHAATKGYNKQILEVKDIIALAGTR